MKTTKNSKPEFRGLTRAEEEVMQVLWEIGEGVVHDLLSRFPDPKPAYNTVSTIIRILEQKGFVGHKAYGRTYVYYPLMEKMEYTKSYFSNMVANHFNNSYRSLVSFFASDDHVGLKELEELRAMLDKEIEAKRKEERP